MSAATPSSDTASVPSLINSRALKLVFFSNEFPHDDKKTLIRRLVAHSKGKQYPILARFIYEATLALREEVRQLPAHLQELIPHFECIFDLADDAKLVKGPLGCSIDEVLLCAFYWPLSLATTRMAMRTMTTTARMPVWPDWVLGF
jgi:hypothetical protein